MLRETQGGGSASSLSSLTGGPVTTASVVAPEGVQTVEAKPEPEPVPEPEPEPVPEPAEESKSEEDKKEN